MKRIAVELTPREHERAERLARDWMKRQGRRVGRGPMAPWVRELIMREILAGGAK